MKVYFEHIYENIGYLFYAVATEHGRLNAADYDKLLRLVDHSWGPVGGNVSLESHLLDYLHSGIRNAIDNTMSSNDAFDHFMSYFVIHSIPFGKPLRSKLLAIAAAIASEFSRNGTKSEYLIRLDKLLAVNSLTPA